MTESYEHLDAGSQDDGCQDDSYAVREIEKTLLDLMPEDKRLCSVYHTTNDDEDGSLCAGALVVKKEFVNSLISAAKHPGQIYELPDMDPLSEDVKRDGLQISYHYRTELQKGLFRLHASVGGRDWHFMGWDCSVDEIVQKYLGQENEEIVEAIMQNRQYLKRNWQKLKRNL
jgi:hypothetical protein